MACQAAGSVLAPEVPFTHPLRKHYLHHRGEIRGSVRVKVSTGLPQTAMNFWVGWYFWSDVTPAK